MAYEEEWSSATDTTRSFWGSGAHPFSGDYEHSYRSRTFTKSPLYRGDHVHAGPYSVATEKVTSNSPLRISARGADGNGSWEDVREIHMSQWLSLPILTIDPRVNADTDNLVDKTVTLALDKLREEKSGWGANVLQAAQTVDMIAANTIAVLEAYKAARKGDWAGVERSLGITGGRKGKRFSGAWLEYIYGWLPLMSDIYGGCKTLTRVVRDENAVKKVVKRGFHEFNHVTPAYGFEDHWKGKVKCEVGLYVKVASDFLESVDSLGVINPLEIGWDVVPFSFVLDWFLPVGNTLSALSATLGLDFVTGYISTSFEISKESKCVYAPAISDGRFSLDDSGSLTVQRKAFNRTPLYAFPRPNFYVNDNPFSSFRLGAAIALITQRATR